MNCPSCGAEVRYTAPIDKLSKTGHIHCTVCGDLIPREKKARKGKSDNQRRSQEQEAKAAKSYGGRTQPGSGSKSHAKGDVLTANARGECKLTRAASFSLKLSELKKIESEAEGVEIPFMEVCFAGQFPHEKYVIMRAADFQAIVEVVGDDKND